MVFLSAIAAQLAGSVAAMAEEQEKTQKQLSSLTALLKEVRSIIFVSHTYI